MGKYLVTGGAGFIGANLVHRLLGDGVEPIVVDNLSRKGAETNLAWLRSQGDFQFVRADIRDPDAMNALFRDYADVDAVVHLAGQVAVTSSVADPRDDFQANALGTLNVLEAVRKSNQRPVFLYASTNKVYGRMADLAVEEHETRYAFRDHRLGIPESFPVDFHSPYGCSKGAADQYVRDYARIYGLPTVVFRQSCIYGERQFGVEDQGWLAWFSIAALLGGPITVYGSGKQVRDVLFVEDLIDAYLLAAANPDTVAGEIYNIGGGPEQTVSVWTEFGATLETLVGHPISVVYAQSRPGDQLVYVSDIRKIDRDLGWRPRTSVQNGIGRMFEWIRNNRNLFETP